MNDPNGISLNVPGSDALSRRREIYTLMHFANLVRKNILLIAPDVDARAFIKFLNGPSEITSHARKIATANLPKTITKSVVAGLGQFQFESKDNIGYSPKFERIFVSNCNNEMAADFFIKNLTTARCNGGIVFLIQPYLVFRYGLKHRESWFDRCRFIWISCALFRLPSLLPVIAAQFFLYTIRIFIKQPSLTRKEELSMLAELLHFLPGIVSVAKPPYGVGLSVWYREMARHRRIVLEAILNEARSGQHLSYFNAPYSMMNFESIDDLILFIEDELKECDKQQTFETERKRSRTKKHSFEEESEVDEEDQELLQLGGFGGGSGEVMEEEEFEVEEIEEYEEVVEQEEDDDAEECSEGMSQFLKSCKSSENMGKGAMAGNEMARSTVQDPFYISDFATYGDLVKKAPDELRETVEKRGKRRIESADEKDEKDKEREVSPPKRLTGLHVIMEEEPFLDNMVVASEIEVGEDENGEEAMHNLFDALPAESWEEEEETDGGPGYDLSTEDIARGFQEAQQLLISQTIGSPMNLAIPMIPETKNRNEDSTSSDSLPSLMDGKWRGGISPLASVPAPHVQFAPRKEIREKTGEEEEEEEDEDEEEDESDVDWGKWAREEIDGR